MPQHHDPEIPPFHLPEWGEAGAPPPPRMEDQEDSPASPRTASPPRPLLTTGEVPGSGILGVLSGVGGADIADRTPEAALGEALEAALAALARQSAAAGAEAVTGVRVTSLARKGRVVVVAYGTGIGAPHRRQGPAPVR